MGAMQGKLFLVKMTSSSKNLAVVGRISLLSFALTIDFVTIDVAAEVTRCEIGDI